MQAPGPAVFCQYADDLLQLAFHFRSHFRARLAEILEVGGREDQHLAGTVVAEVVVALLVFDRLRPVQEVLLLFLRLLGEEIVGQTHRHLVLVGELLDDRIVVRIVLEAAARIDDAGDAEAVQFAHEMAGRIDLVVEGKLRPLGERRIENARIRLGEQHARSGCRWHRG